jgi:hypothetical protein
MLRIALLGVVIDGFPAGCAAAWTAHYEGYACREIASVRAGLPT